MPQTRRPKDESEPVPKKRRLNGQPSMGSQSHGIQSQPSFADVLEKLEENKGNDRAAEGGADSWARPALARIDPAKDKIVFQQIDVETATNPRTGRVELRMFGMTQEGHSVLAHVTDFAPYFYIPVPRGFTKDDLHPFKIYLNGATGDAIDTIEFVVKRSLWGYKGDDYVTFMKITVVVGMNWIEVPAGTYILVNGSRKSNCQIELDVKWDKFISHAPEGQWSKIGPLRILSFDIECAGRKGIFPEANVDPVIQIANMVTRQGESKPFIRNVFTLNTCAHIVGSQVLSFDDEAKMLESWRDFVQEIDPDVIIGYNIANFDLPYLLDRAKAIKALKFPYLGRFSNVRTQIKDTHFSSKAFGQRDSKETNMEGRLQLDVLQFMQREHKLRSYTLNSVCAQFLGEQKEDVHHSVITELQNGTSESRRRLAVYCLKDAYLPQRLMDKLMCFVNYTEMARLFRKANEEQYIVPALKGEGSDEQYEGATVIEPKKGYYDVPIATLDFSSLYPSIMMAHNLCYTTLLEKGTIERLNLQKDVDYIQTPNN
ncbi:hypothetical protein EWM64_g8027, partial [Hericium alpestre]